MKKFILISFLLSLFLVALSGCGKGKSPATTPPPTGGGQRAPSPSILGIETQGGQFYVLGKKGAVMPASIVEVSAGGEVKTITANADGSFSVFFPQAPVGPVVVSYTSPRGERRSIYASIASYEGNLTKDFIRVGSAPNDMLFTEDKLLVANYADNTVTIYDRATLELLETVTLPIGSGPSYLAAFSDKAYVACNGNNTIYSFSLKSGEELGTVLSSVELDAKGAEFLGPGKLFANGKRIFVPVANIQSFVNPGEVTPYLPAELIVIDDATFRVTDRLILNGFDATEVMELSPGKLLVVEVGMLSFDSSFNPFLASGSLLEVVDASSLEIENTVELGLFGASAPSYDAQSNQLFVGSLLEASIVVVDTETWAAERTRPTKISDARTFIADSIIFSDSLILSSFNEDKIYALDATSLEAGVYPLPEPLFVGEKEEGFLAGVQNLFLDEENNTLYFLQGLANRIGKFELP